MSKEIPSKNMKSKSNVVKPKPLRPLSQSFKSSNPTNYLEKNGSNSGITLFLTPLLQTFSHSQTLPYTSSHHNLFTSFFLFLSSTIQHLLRTTKAQTQALRTRPVFRLRPRIRRPAHHPVDCPGRRWQPQAPLAPSRASSPRDGQFRHRHHHHQSDQKKQD